jgi:transcriptional regulator
MYVPEHFQQEDREAALDLVARHDFGLLVAGGDAAHIPFELDRAHQVLRCHVARANPIWKDAVDRPVLTVFSGPHAYISPDWYEGANLVPTWNYLAVHIHGIARQLPAPALEAHLHALAAQEERHLAPKPAWDMGRVEARMLTALQRGVVGLEIPLERVDAKWKLSQNRGIADRRKVIAALRRRGGENNTAIADAMDLREKDTVS